MAEYTGTAIYQGKIVNVKVTSPNFTDFTAAEARSIVEAAGVQKGSVTIKSDLKNNLPDVDFGLILKMAELFPLLPQPLENRNKLEYDRPLSHFEVTLSDPSGNDLPVRFTVCMVGDTYFAIKIKEPRPVPFEPIISLREPDSRDRYGFLDLREQNISPERGWNPLPIISIEKSYPSIPLKTDKLDFITNKPPSSQPQLSKVFFEPPPQTPARPADEVPDLFLTLRDLLREPIPSAGSESSDPKPARGARTDDKYWDLYVRLRARNEDIIPKPLAAPKGKKTPTGGK
ncbi:hypothetical protein HY988_04250 [Candidatus Micrarchaeota archaeon]|nr:hypothetical protein [Candidatus Micrarchaeota archaeon]